MSFLDSVLTSLETGKPVPLSSPAAAPRSSVSAQVGNRKADSGHVAQAAGASSSGIKRKADDQLPRPSKPEVPPSSRTFPSRPAALSTASKPNASTSSPQMTNQGLSNSTSRSIPSAPSSALSAKPLPSKATPAKSAAPRPNLAKVPSAPAAAPRPAVTKATPVSSKPPPKGSFAALMQQAKAIQEKAPAPIGIVRHQKVQKERLSKVERRRRLEEAKAQTKAARTGKRTAPAAAASSSTTAVKRRTPEPLSYKGTAKPASNPEPIAYKGTAGRQSQRSSVERRPAKRRMDEYLATDEEDEGDYGGYEDQEDYYSDASSDMEAGFDDVREEEDAALKYARKEDEEELRREMIAKKEKLERQKKLEALAASRNRR